MDAVRNLNFRTHSHIVEVCNNNKKSAYGYVWEFANKEEIEWN